MPAFIAAAAIAAGVSGGVALATEAVWAAAVTIATNAFVTYTPELSTLREEG